MKKKKEKAKPLQRLRNIGGERAISYALGGDVEGAGRFRLAVSEHDGNGRLDEHQFLAGGGVEKRLAVAVSDTFRYEL